MKRSFHFDIGNSNEGPVGAAGRIVAENREAAVERLRYLLERFTLKTDEPLEGVSVFDGNENLEGVHADEYFNVYLNPDKIVETDIDSEDDVVSEGS